VAGPALAPKTAKGSAGSWLTNSVGRALYVYTLDKGKASECYGACAKAWVWFLVGPVANVMNGTKP
jgi:predicted lipoprotein with Yx(FWY)xxD motif